VSKFHSDENFDRHVVEELRKLGHNVLNAFEAGRPNQGIPDREFLDFGIRYGRAVLTFDRRDFKRLHRIVRPHCGIVICTDDPDVFGLAMRIHERVVALPSLTDPLINIVRPSQP
jgi:hypothetical protein